MKKIATVVLQIVIVLIGVGALAFMLWEPHVEGVNANAAFFEVYADPFIVYMYIASIAFFAVLYQIFKVLGNIGQDKTFSQATLKALRTIRYCATTFVVLVTVPVGYLFIARPEDDIAGGVAVGLFIVLVSVVTAIVATMYGRFVQKAVEGK